MQRSNRCTWLPAAVLLIGGCSEQAGQSSAAPVSVSVPPASAVAACGLAAAQVGEFVKIPAGHFTKGASPMYPEERSGMSLYVRAFELQRHEVTNAQFAVFVKDTGYMTDAERSAQAGRIDGGSALFAHRGGIDEQAGWQLAAAATWRSPEGDNSTIDGRERHPVVHVSLRDARAYATWAGGRLPSEEEWEYAASLGLPEPARPVSGARSADGTLLANTWQGAFPYEQTADDGFAGAAPGGCFPADRLGLYDMIGNVWEWTETPFDGNNFTVKGGSFLCANNYCRRYRPAARQPQEADFSTSHIGFRIARDV